MGNVILAAGGTGGHIFPALAVAETLSASGHNVTLLTDKRGVPMVEGRIAYQVIASASPFTKGMAAKFTALMALEFGFFQSLFIMFTKRPDAVIGFGGYPSLAPLVAGRLLRAKCILHEQNAVMGRANRLLAKIAHCVALSFTPTKGCPSDVATDHTGLPVREAFASITTYQPIADTCHLVIIGGSLGARIFAQMLPEAIAQLPQSHKSGLRITQQARDEDIQALQQAYDAQGICAQIARFYHDIAGLYESADIIISRAGASSVGEISAAGRASILLPFAGAMDDHQTGNAQTLSSCQAAILIPEDEASPSVIASHLHSLIADTAQRRQMANAAAALSQPDTALRIAALTGLPVTSSGAVS